jgi:hypothetical protein
MCVFIYIYIYIYIERERERHTHTHMDVDGGLPAKVSDMLFLTNVGRKQI